jgi:hypothetical protein
MTHRPPKDSLGTEPNYRAASNASEWELKCQRADTTSLMTHFHVEPSPQALEFVHQMLLPKYGWSREQAAGKYPEGEYS